MAICDLGIDGVDRHFPGDITSEAIIEDKRGRLWEGWVYEKEENEGKDTPWEDCPRRLERRWDHR